MTGRIRVVAALLVGAATTVLVGCGSSAAPGLPASDTGLVDHRTGEIRLPLDAFRPSADQRAVLLAAQDKILGECMMKTNFSFPQPPREPDHSPSRRYGVWYGPVALRDGYGLPPESASAKKVMAANRVSFSKAGETQLEKCSRDPELHEVAFDEMPVSQMDVSVFRQFVQKGTGRAPLKEWAACMADNRHPVDLSGANLFVPSDVGKSRNGDLAIVRVDLRCKAKTRFIDRMASGEAAAEQEFIARNGAILDKYRNAAQQAVARARQVLRAT